MSYQVHNFIPHTKLPAASLNEMDAQIALNEAQINSVDWIAETQVVGFTSASRTWTVDEKYKHIVIRVNAGDKVDFVGGSKSTCHIGILRSYNVIAGGAVDYTTDADLGKRLAITVNATASYTMPADVKYLYITTRNNGSDCVPVSIKINGIEMRYGIREMIGDVVDNIKTYVAPSNGVDFNSIIASGYYPLGYFNTHGHSPFIGNGRRFLLVFTRDKLGHQMVVDLDDHSIYIRWRADGAWNNDWVKIGGIPDKETMPFEYGHVANTSSVENVGTAINVLSYNVGVYNNGNTSSKGFNDADFDEKVLNLKRFVMTVNADFMGLQEDTPNVDKAQTKDGHSWLYKPMYPFKNTLGGSSIYSKANASKSGSRNNSTNGRYMAWCEYTINGKKLLLVCMHPSPDTTEHRTAEYNDLFTFVNGRTWDWCVVCGDMNSIEASDRESLKALCATNNFTMANGGYLGWLVTTPYPRSLDNILVSQNCIINSVKVWSDWASELNSDHYPITANITLLN